MSKEYPTVNETIAYDEGFADAEDYWCAKEQERIIKLLEDKLPKTLRLTYEVCRDETGLYDANFPADLVKDAFIALIKGEK